MTEYTVSVYKFNFNTLEWEHKDSIVAYSDKQLLEVVKMFTSTYRNRYKIYLSQKIGNISKLSENKCPFCESQVTF